MTIFHNLNFNPLDGGGGEIFLRKALTKFYGALYVSKTFSENKMPSHPRKEQTQQQPYLVLYSTKLNDSECVCTTNHSI